MWAYIRAHGGLWRYRERFRTSTNPLVKRVRNFVYTHYLEQLGSFIAIEAEFAAEPYFPHGVTSIFVAPRTQIGTGVTIHQQVTIGLNDLLGSKGFGSPTIGNNVYIGAGAIIIGNVKIGDGARIGAGALVVKDVPAGALAVSPPARLVH